MRICLVYDCLFPFTVGGAERWYRNLGERLAAEGHDVTYLTLRQWDRGTNPGVSGVDVRAVGPRMALYTGPGRRRILPPLVFGLGVLCHLLRHGRRYDAVHTASFPYFSLLAAAVARRGGYQLVVDWHEAWSRAYWREYLGRWAGDIGWAVQLACIRLPQRAFCFSRLHENRLRDEGFRGEITRLSGEYVGPVDPPEPVQPEPIVVFAGRHIPEKRAAAILPALATVRRDLPQLRAVILGDGPDRQRLLDLRRDLGLDSAVDIPGFVSPDAVQGCLARALCMILPSRREGYGLIVIEAASHGTPSIVVAAPDNAAVELIEDGSNGFIAPSASPEDLAEAIVRVYEAGQALRDSTAAWFEGHARLLSLSASLEIALETYARR